MAQLKNCKFCGKLFLDTGRGMCPDCNDKVVELEHIVTEFVREHKKATISEIVEGTGVKEKIILKMIRDGRFIESGVEISYPCEKCGAPITRGKICDKCNAELLGEVAKATANAQKRLANTDRSHTLNMMKNR